MAAIVSWSEYGSHSAPLIENVFNCIFVLRRELYVWSGNQRRPYLRYQLLLRYRGFPVWTASAGSRSAPNALYLLHTVHRSQLQRNLPCRRWQHVSALLPLTVPDTEQITFAEINPPASRDDLTSQDSVALLLPAGSPVRRCRCDSGIHQISLRHQDLYRLVLGQFFALIRVNAAFKCSQTHQLNPLSLTKFSFILHPFTSRQMPFLPKL